MLFTVSIVWAATIGSISGGLPLCLAQQDGSFDTIWDEESLTRRLASSRASLDSLKAVNMESHMQQVASIGGEGQRLEGMRDLIARQQAGVDELIGSANTKQLERLISRLQETMKKEKVLRDARPEESTEESTKVEVEVEVEVETVMYDDIVPIGDLDERLQVSKILHESENELRSWVVKTVQDEILGYKASSVKKQRPSPPEVKCPPLREVVQDVHSALSKFSQDGTGMLDHAQGAEIVHSMTSNTYTPSLQPSDLLGNAWWRRYIPQDWERLLPRGWQDWNIGLPPYVFHSLGMTGSNAAPPETILQKSTHAGSCWPMEGRRGQVTLRLQYPVRVDSFTIDHVPLSIVPGHVSENAPKIFQVIGYPTCESKECSSMGFDPTNPMQIGQFNFDLEGSSVQTFDSIFSPTSQSDSSLEELEDDEEEDEEYNEEGASCSAEAAACSSPPMMDVAGITLKILDNWGNHDFTCLYRFRVHGEPIH